VVIFTNDHAQAMTRAEIRRAMAIVVEHRNACWRDGGISMADLTHAEIDAALALGEKQANNEPRARSARYDRASGRIEVELTSGAAFAFPARLGQGLEAATEEELAQVLVSPGGYGLHWKALDVDLSIPGLAAGVFGTKAHMARIAGQARSVAKSAAARANGAKGGRPRKSGMA